MSAAGRVAIGFSKPYVANYVNNAGIISFASARVLARGVKVSIELDDGSDNVFYADNQAAETDAGSFTGCTLTLTVDGLFTNAARFLYGLPSKDANGWVAYDDTMQKVHKAVGYIGKYMSNGEISYVPTIIVKCSFNQPGEELNTQEDTISWQTTDLSAKILRGDDANHTWKFITEDGYSTEEAAEAVLQAKLGYVPPTMHDVTQTLTNVTSSFIGNTIADGAALNATLTANIGYTLDTVTVKMGGTDITSTVVTGGTVAIPAVTGDVVITATGVSA